VALVVATVLAVGLLAPGGARGDAYLGSTLLLDHAPNASEPVAVDSVFWLTALANDRLGLRRYRVAQSGQVLQFEVRGYTAGTQPAPIHFQDLRPVAGGGLQIVASSQAYPLPVVDGVWSFDPTNFCVRAGDFLGFNEEGGAVVDVFGAIRGSTTQRYSANDATMNGEMVTPTALPNVELLMSAYEGTGPHASPLCGGINGIQLNVTARSARVRASGALVLPVACTGPLPCPGTLSLLATEPGAGNGQPRSVVIGHAPLGLATHSDGDLTVTLSGLGRRLLGDHHGRLVTTASARLGAGLPGDTVTSTVTLTG
jgi:hypothetical protein